MVRTIKIADSTHDKLTLIKKANRLGSFDGTIQWLIQGNVNELNVINREQIAFTLTYEGYGNVDMKTKSYEVFEETELNVTYKELKKAEIGDIYEPEISNNMYYSYSIAQVIYTESDFVALKITTYTYLEWLPDDTRIELIGVNLF